MIWCVLLHWILSYGNWASSLRCLNTDFYHLLLLYICIDKGYLKYIGECVFPKILHVQSLTLGITFKHRVVDVHVFLYSVADAVYLRKDLQQN